MTQKEFLRIMNQLHDAKQALWGAELDGTLPDIPSVTVDTAWRDATQLGSIMEAYYWAMCDREAER